MTAPSFEARRIVLRKWRQEEFVTSYCGGAGIPYAILRPGYVYGPGKHFLSDRVGIDTFGIFLHLGGSNTVPLTYVDNCAEAIVLAGLTPGVDGEVFNVVDDNLPSSRTFLREYKRNVRRFRSLYLPHAVSICSLLSVGTLLGILSGPTPVRVQSAAMVRLLEAHPLYQRQAQDTFGLDP